MKKKKSKKMMSIGTKILFIVVAGLAVPIAVLIGSFLFSMNKVADDSQKIVAERLMAEVKNEIQYSVQSAASMAEGIYHANEGKVPHEELFTSVMSYLNMTKYGTAGYFFAYQYDGVRVLAPENPAQVGKNLWENTDPNGIKVTQEVVKAAKSQGGFITYTWMNPATKKNEQKISYVVPLKLGSHELAFGTGTYLPMIEASKQEINQTISQTKNQTAFVVIAISLLISLLVLGFIYFYTRNAIVKPVKKLVVIADDLADGNLDVSIAITSNDEIGLLADSFQKMTENLNEVLTNINVAASQVAMGAGQVSDSSIALSQGATQQASSIQQLTASIEEISYQTKQNAQNANKANELAEAAKANALVGNNQMSQMLNAMEEINDASGRISKIIKVIDDIAFQTNILALNAAVEAARAGQHGKGFAVVAEEVRNLAARSANAAKETTNMIEGSIRKVEGGTRIANETAVALNSIVDGVAKVAVLIEEIASSSTDQAESITQINQGVNQVSQVTQTNSATSEESAAASEELSGQAHMLKEQVSRFRLKAFPGRLTAQ